MNEIVPIKSSDIVLRQLDGSFDVSTFDCGVEELNGYLQENALDDYNRRMSVTYVLLHDQRIIAYYSILTDRVDTKVDPIRRSVRDRLKRKMDYRYTSMPAIKIGRLAVDKNYQNAEHCDIHLGNLIVSALKFQYAINPKFGCRLLTVDALNCDKTLHFYEKNGFIRMIAEKIEDKDATIPMFFDLATMEA